MKTNKTMGRKEKEIFKAEMKDAAKTVKAQALNVIKKTRVEDLENLSISFKERSSIDFCSL